MYEDIDTIKKRLGSLRYEMRLVMSDDSLAAANRALRMGQLTDEMAELDRLCTKAEQLSRVK